MNDLCMVKDLHGSKAWVHFPKAFYHVIDRGNRRQAIFLDEQDYQRYLSYLPEYETLYPFHLYAHALIWDHCLTDEYQTENSDSTR